MWWEDISRQWEGYSDQTCKPEVYSRDAIQRTSETKVRRSQGTQELFEEKLIQSSITGYHQCET